jgi:hypothetical protein
MLHLDVNRSEREADCLLTCSVERKTKWCRTSTLKYTFIACVVMTSLYVLRHFLQYALCNIPTPDILLICGGDLDCGLQRCDAHCGTVHQNTKPHGVTFHVLHSTTREISMSRGIVSVVTGNITVGLRLSFVQLHKTDGA